ncbi:ORF6N domain-containing protein [Fibrobacter sp. UWB13]|uniref:ORF6N domain-containing protein n=1 Tax=Fibrobacter sp. UWB13 TaxID=1896204 RepID=UPI000A09F671|nr:ORF6N domain-containing protein [Fibrobacter sp. UWB13]SMG26687.1 ORF6N domain-containing protein [Fibrobacter sp. UWB13]
MKKQENLSANADEKPEFSLIDENLLKSKIYTIRGLKVMLDADLAEIYGYETRKFNEQVKHNIKKFDDDFRFQLSESEFIELKSNLMSKIWTSSWGGVRKQPFAFTEQGIYMLMTVLRGEQAIAQSKALIRLFKQMKDYIVAENQQLPGNAGLAELAVQTVQNTRDIAVTSANVRELSGEVHDVRKDLCKMNIDLQKVMENFIDPSTYKHFLIFDGQKLEADVAYTKIYAMAKKSITIIDNYVGVKTLDLLRGIAKGVSVQIFSEQWGNEKITPAIKADYEKARPDVSLKIDRPNRKFHDRYTFLDYGLPNEKLFHCGASSKDGGNKITTIMQVECPEVYHPIMDEFKKVTASEGA